MAFTRLDNRPTVYVSLIDANCSCDVSHCSSSKGISPLYSRCGRSEDIQARFVIVVLGVFKLNEIYSPFSDF